MGSNVLEWTAMIYRIPHPKLPPGILHCVNLGLDHANLAYETAEPPHTATLAVNRQMSCDERDSPENSSSKQIGFRCATSVKAAPAAAPPDQERREAARHF